MRGIRSIAVAAAIALVAAPAAAGMGELALQSGSTLSLRGNSTMHDYHSQASKLEVTIQSDAARWPAGKSGSEALEAFIRDGGVTGIDVVVPVAGLRSGKDGLDKNMHKALKAATSPEIRFHMAGYEIGAAANAAETRIDAKGKLSIAGVDREVPITATVVRDGEVMRLRGEVPLLMTQFGIKPPTMMMGAIKTADQVVVSFDLRIGAQAGSGTMTRAE